MSGKPLSVVFIGCGQAARMHSRTLARVAPDVRRLYASRDMARARAFDREYRGAGAFGSYADAFAARDIDAVVIVTPPSSHLDLTLDALAVGKHVIVEKPAFLRAADFDTVAHAAARVKRRVLVAENYFYKPLLERLRGIVASDALGEIRFLHVNALKQQSTGDWRDDAALAGGGALFEGGVHWIDFMANLGLEVRAARGFRPGATNGPDDGLERSMLVVFEYANGAVGTLSYSWEVHAPLKGIRMSRIYGTHGAAAFESNGILLLQTGRRKRLTLPGFRDIAGYRGMFRDFVAALREDREPRFDLARARRDIELIEEAYGIDGLGTAGRGLGRET